MYGCNLPDGKKQNTGKIFSLLEEQQESPPRPSEGTLAESGRKLSKGLERQSDC